MNKSLWHLTLTPFLLAMSFGAIGAEYTNIEEIKTIEWNGQSNEMYFTNKSNIGWGAPSCPNATYILIDPSLSNPETFYSLAMAAHATSSQVRFYGSCDSTSPHNFKATYVTVY